MGLLLFYLGSFRLACFFWGLFTILQAHGPLFLPFGFNGFLLTLLILLPHCLPYCWAFSCFWAFLPKWPSTTVSDSVLSFHSRFHFPVLRFQLLMAAFMSSFLSSHLYKYWHKLGDSVEVSLHLNFFCALFFCLMVFSPFYVCFGLFRVVVWMVATLHLLSKSFLLGCWICYCWVI